MKNKSSIRPNDILADNDNGKTINGMVIRKGTIAAFLANIDILENPNTPQKQKQEVIDTLKELAPAVVAIGLHMHVIFKNPQAEQILVNATTVKSASQVAAEKQALIQFVTHILEQLQTKKEEEEIARYKNVLQFVYANFQESLIQFKKTDSQITQTQFKEKIQTEIKSALNHLDEAPNWQTFLLNILRKFANRFLAHGNQYTLFRPKSFNGLREIDLELHEFNISPGLSATVRD